MPARLVITADAALELVSIVDYIKEDLGTPATADSFVSEFRRIARLACSFPESKPLCPDPYLSSRGYRSFQVKNYIALYLYSDGIVYVDHVFHRSQDYAAPVVENAEYFPATYNYAQGILIMPRARARGSREKHRAFLISILPERDDQLEAAAVQSTTAAAQFDVQPTV